MAVIEGAAAGIGNASVRVDCALASSACRPPSFKAVNVIATFPEQTVPRVNAQKGMAEKGMQVVGDNSGGKTGMRKGRGSGKSRTSAGSVSMVCDIVTTSF